MGLTVTHDFVSAKADTADATLIQPSNWNENHVISGLPFYNVPDFKWSQQPGGSLSVGSNTITLTPVPKGVNGTNTNFYVRIDGGSGTAETCLVTGGTAVSEATSGTLIITCANTHSGSFTVRSASDGLAESLWEAYTEFGGGISAGNREVYVSELTNIYTKVTVPSGLWVNIRGNGPIVASLKRHSSYVNGDLIYVPSGSAPAFTDLTIQNATGTQATSGAAIHCHTQGLWANNLTIWSGYRGVILEGTSESRVSNFQFQTLDGLIPDCGVYMHKGTGPFVPQDTMFVGGKIYTHNNSFAGFKIEGCDSLLIEGFTIAFGNYAISMIPNADSGAYIASFVINGNIMDEQTLQAMTLTLLNSGTSFGLGVISNNTMNGESDTNTLYGIDIGIFGAYTGINNIIIANNTITRYYKWGIGIGATVAQSNIMIRNNAIVANNIENALNQGGILLSGIVDGVSIIGNEINSGNVNVGVYAGTACNRIRITDNNFDGVTNPINMTTPTKAVIANNLGVDNVMGAAIASNTSITIPTNTHNPLVALTGTTTITTINGGWIGRTITFYKTDAGSITVGGGGNIPGSHTLAQYSRVTLTFDGTNWY